MSNTLGHILIATVLVGMVSYGYSMWVVDLNATYGGDISTLPLINATGATDIWGKNASSQIQQVETEVSGLDMIVTGGLNVLKMFYEIPNILGQVSLLMLKEMGLPHEAVNAFVSTMAVLLVILGIIYAIFKVKP